VTDFGRSSDSALLVADTASRDATPATTANMAHVWVLQELVVVGMQHTIGPVTLAVETGPGFRMATIWPDKASSHGTMALDYVLDVRPRAIVWVHPHWTIGAQAGVDLLHPEMYSLTAFVGVHLAAYDKTR
jgi:hypothetical protein